MLLDAVIIMVCITGLLILSSIASDVPGSGRLLVFGTVALLVFYEPLMVWRFGATIGHQRNNLRVVADATGENPGPLRALARYLVKTVLGLFSFATMALTVRHQAVHDRLTGTTVQIRDMAQAKPGDLEWERAPLPVVGMPSRLRRSVVISIYELVILAVLGTLQTIAVSEQCAFKEICSAGEKLLSGIISLVWMGAAVALLIYGWRARLLGARMA